MINCAIVKMIFDAFKDYNLETCQSIVYSDRFFLSIKAERDLA